MSSLFSTGGASNNIIVSNYNIYTVAGTGTSGNVASGVATAVNCLSSPGGVAVDTGGNIFIADGGNHRVLYVPKLYGGTSFGVSAPNANQVYRVAGSGTSGTATSGSATATNCLNTPGCVALDVSENLYIADRSNNRIQYIPKTGGGTWFGVSTPTANNIYTIAGSGTSGSATGGSATATNCLNLPFHVAFDNSVNLYIADKNNHRIQYVPKVGGGTLFGISTPTANNIYTIAGNGTSGTATGAAAGTISCLNSPSSVFIDTAGNMLIADSGNNRIVLVPKSFGYIYGVVIFSLNYPSTVAGSQAGTAGTQTGVLAYNNACLTNPQDVRADSAGNMYISDQNRILFVPAATGTYFGQSMTVNYIYTIAGTGTSGISTNTVALNNVFNSNSKLVFDSFQNLYIVDGVNHRLQLLPSVGSIRNTNIIQSVQTTQAYHNYMYKIIGSGTSGIASGGLASFTNCLNSPSAVAVDISNNIYIADTQNKRVQVVPVLSGQTLFGVSMPTAFAIYTLVSTTNNTLGLTFDAAGNLFVADTAAVYVLPKTTATYFGTSATANTLTRIAGTGTAGNGTTSTVGGTNIAPTACAVNNPVSPAFDVCGNLYFPDSINYRLLFIPKTSGSFFGSAGYTANNIYNIVQMSLADGLRGVAIDPGINLFLACSSNIYFVPSTTGTYFGTSMTGRTIYSIIGGISIARDVTLDSANNLYIVLNGNHRVAFVPRLTGTYFGVSMTANTMYTIAGQNNTSGSPSATGILATSGNLNSPIGMCLDAYGNMYIADTTNHCIQVVANQNTNALTQTLTPNYMYTVGGVASNYGYLPNGVFNAYPLSLPQDVFVDLSGNYFVLDSNANNRVLFVPKTSGTYYGQTMAANYVYGIAGIFATGSAGAGSFGLSVAMNNPTALAVDSAGNVYVADSGNHRVLFMPKTTATYFGVAMVANWMYVIAGTGASGTGTSGSLATSCALNNPTGVCVDSAGNVFIADNGNNRIMFIPKTSGTYFGSVNATTNFGNYLYTMPGYASLLSAPRKITVDSSNHFCVASYGNHTIVFYPVANGTYFGTSMTANTGYKIVGVSATSGISAEGTGIATSRLFNPQSGCIDSSGNLYIADFQNQRIVFVPQTAGTYFGVSMTANSTYTIAGANTTATSGFAGDFGLYASSRLQSPSSVCVDVGGNVVIADTYNSRIRMVVRSTIGSSYLNNNANVLFNSRNTGYFINGIDVANYPNLVSLS